VFFYCYGCGYGFAKKDQATSIRNGILEIERSWFDGRYHNYHGLPLLPKEVFLSKPHLSLTFPIHHRDVKDYETPHGSYRRRTGVYSAQSMSILHLTSDDTCAGTTQRLHVQ